MKNLKKSDIVLHASINAVVAHFHQLPYAERITNIEKRVSNLTEPQVENTLKEVLLEFENRHRFIKELLTEAFTRCLALNPNLAHYTQNRKLLLGAYLTKEYSIQSAALFNPSIVPHPDQSGLKAGEQRFIMSLRATGEGHISSIIFKTGVIDKDGNSKLDPPTGFHTILKKDAQHVYSREWLEKLTSAIGGMNKEILHALPLGFTLSQAKYVLSKIALNDANRAAMKAIEEAMDSNYTLVSDPNVPLSEKVIFPSAKSESMGMEDLRLVAFNDGDERCYYGTYTAYDGKKIKTQLLKTYDFQSFEIRSFYGAAVNDKGMALLPEKIGGKYVMISRQGSELISIMQSADLYNWEHYSLLLEPQFEWEFVQIGNCGSPVKTEKGWLLLTHGVGAMRKYVISAILLYLHDPSVIISRLETPLLTAEGWEREGYVPNVVYTCGMLQHGDLIMIPYAVSDTATRFATVSVKELLDEMKPYKK